MTKTLCTFIRTLSVAALLAVAAMSLPTSQGHAHAESAGCSSTTCGTKFCQLPADPKPYTGGDTVDFIGPDGKLHVLMCDGFTGRWVVVFNRPNPPTRGPRVPVAPLPGGGVLSVQ